MGLNCFAFGATLIKILRGVLLADMEESKALRDALATLSLQDVEAAPYLQSLPPSDYLGRAGNTHKLNIQLSVC